MADVGTGSTLHINTAGSSPLGGSASTLEITGITMDGQERQAFDVSHLATTGARVKIFGRLHDEGSISVEFQVDETDIPDIRSGTLQAVGVLFPDGNGYWGDAQITRVNWGQPVEGVMTGTVVFTFAGVVTKVAAV
jgi:hypothetical protein